MALDKLVDSSQLDSDLGDIADAIRAKGGTGGQLQFPQGFVDAVEAIETGGEDEYGLKDVSFFPSDGSWQAVVTNNRITQYSIKASTNRYFLLKKPIVLVQGDVLTLTYKKISGTAGYTDFKVIEQPWGADTLFSNFAPYATANSKTWTKTSEIPATIVGIGFCTRNTGPYTDATIAMKIEVNGVTLFSSL